MSRTEWVRRLAAHAAAPYRACGPAPYHFARGKLAGDPAFAALMSGGFIPDGARLLDLGCGAGLLAASLAAADELHAQGRWPATLLPPPAKVRVYGIDLSTERIRLARAALGEPARFVAASIVDADFPPFDVAVLLDVLHYIGPADQEAVLRRLVASMSEDGQLILRVGDAGGGWRYRWSQWVDKLVVFCHSRQWPALHGRRLGEWIALLESLGLAVEAKPMSTGTAFANTLLVCQRCGAG